MYSVQFSCSVVSDSLQPLESQHTRPPCPSPTPRVHPNPCPLSQWCHPTISSPVVPSPPALNLSQHQGLFQWVSSLYQVAKCWSFSFSISSSGEYSGLISLRIHWFDLEVQGALKSLLQHYGSKASILWHSAFFIVQLSHPYMTTGKTIALTRWTFVGKVMSLLFNMLSRLVIAFLPRSKRLLILWPQSPSAVILEPEKIKSVTVSTLSPSMCHQVFELDAMILVCLKLSFKPNFSLSSFTFIKRLFGSSTSATRFMSSVYLRLLIFPSSILIPPCTLSRPAFYMIYSA